MKPQGEIQILLNWNDAANHQYLPYNKCFWVSLIWTFNYAIFRRTGEGYIAKTFVLEDKLFAIILKLTVI
jgi:hypothetical protein